MTEPTGHDRAADQAVALESENELGKTLRRLGAEQPAADRDRGEVRLVAGALGELGRATDQSLWVARGIDDGLRVQVDDGTLLLLPLGHRFMQFCSLGKVLATEASGGVGLKDHAHRKNDQIIRARLRHDGRPERDRRCSSEHERTRPPVRNGLAAVSAAMT
jgi:hypothetical protein